METPNLVNLSDELIATSDNSFLSLCFYGLKRLPSCDNEVGRATLLKVQAELNRRNVNPHDEMRKAIGEY